MGVRISPNNIVPCKLDWDEEYPSFYLFSVGDGRNDPPKEIDPKCSAQEENKKEDGRIMSEWEEFKQVIFQELKLEPIIAWLRRVLFG